MNDGFTRNKNSRLQKSALASLRLHESSRVRGDGDFLEDNTSDIRVADQNLVNHLDRSVREMEDELGILSLK